ncbi:hypothetical protein [Sorangium sp. So ce1099]|uniref:hypothetical protein n=1 Tax=Sorangium sp. So ce1099 TaxID=3133331 RepID=UPI003F61E57B
MTRPRSSRWGALSVLALCAVSLGSPRVAQAAPPYPRLAVHRAPAAEGCPDALSLAAAVEHLMKQPALDPVSSPASSGGGAAAPGGDPASAGGDPASRTAAANIGAPSGGAAAANTGAPASAGTPSSGAAAANTGAPASAAPAAATIPPSSGAGAASVAPPDAVAPVSAGGAAPEYEVHFLRTGATYTAVLQAGGRTRQLSSEPGAACDELVGALALTIAILLDSEATPATAPAAVAPAPVAPAPVLPAPAPPPPPRPAPGWDVSAEIGAAGTVGMLDPLRPAVMGELSLRRRAWSAGLGAVWLPLQEIDVTPGAASIGLVAAAARGCATITGELGGFRLSACAASLLGAVHGAGKGFTPDREASAPWFAVGGSAIAEGPLFGTRALGWSARATLLVPISRARFTVDRRSGSAADAPVTTEAVLDPSPVGLLVGLGARVSIF